MLVLQKKNVLNVLNFCGKTANCQLLGYAV